MHTRGRLTGTHAVSIDRLPNHHKDPFDRMLIAQAEAERFALLTADSDSEPRLVGRDSGCRRCRSGSLGVNAASPAATVAAEDGHEVFGGHLTPSTQALPGVFVRTTHDILLLASSRPRFVGRFSRRLPLPYGIARLRLSAAGIGENRLNVVAELRRQTLPRAVDVFDRGVGITLVCHVRNVPRRGGRCGDRGLTGECSAVHFLAGSSGPAEPCDTQE